MSAADAARKVAEDYRLSANVTAYEEGGQSYLYDALAEAFEKFAEALERGGVPDELTYPQARRAPWPSRRS